LLREEVVVVLADQLVARVTEQCFPGLVEADESQVRGVLDEDHVREILDDGV